MDINDTNNISAIAGNKNVEKFSNESNKDSSSNVDECNILMDKSENGLNRTSRSQFQYQKRTGTSGLGGQLYETKLISLILLRLLKDNNVSEFHLGTNIDGIGAFDDIVLKYKVIGLEKPKIVFIQAKHRDDPKKNKLTIDEILQEKYLDSYIKINHKFFLNNEDDMFNDVFKGVDCSFIFYTPAIENIQHKKLTFDKSTKYFITGSTENVFQFDYNENDIENLLKTVLLSRSKLLAKTFMRFILKDNYHNMMSNDLIRIYHVFLAHNVLNIRNSKSSVLNAEFSSSFLKSQNFLAKSMRAVIYQQLMSKYTNSNLDVIEVLTKSFSFKLPYNFGNLNFCINGKDQKKKRGINYLCLKLKTLLDSNDHSNIIKVNDDMLGANEILQHKDLEIYRLGGLVGNFLILDEETGLLKINHSEKLISEDTIKLYEQLKTDCPNTDFTKYRFDIDCYRFPKLTLLDTSRDRKLITDFLNKLKFYTSQAQEYEVERILKHEINDYCNISGKNNNSLYSIKGEALFLKVHHEIQKWWMQPTKAPYLNKNCNYYKDAENEIFNSSLISTFNYLCIKNINSVDVKFKESAMDYLSLDTFLMSNYVLNIVTRDIIITSFKLREFLLKSNKYPYVFLDLQLLVSEECFEGTLTEIRNTNIKLFVILCKSSDLLEKLTTLLNLTKELTIVITEWMLDVQAIKTDNIQKILQIVDNKTTFVDLTTESQNELLEKTVMFQGSEIALGKLLNKRSHHLLGTDMLRAFINNEKVLVGKPLKTTKYNELKDYYVEQNILRCIKLNLNASLKPEFTTVFTGHVEDILPVENQDIILLSDKNQEFVNLCEKYTNHNIHWFRNNGADNVWQKTFGKLSRLLQHVERNWNESYLRKPMSILNLEDRIVILSAEAGMGKSTLMTYLSVQTKYMHPELWIIRINLIEYKVLFSKWEENKMDINLKETMKFLFAASSVKMDEKVNGMNSSLFDSDLFDVHIDENGAILLACNKNHITSFSLLEIELFCDCYNNGQIVLLFDGFDEISPDYTKEVISMMEVLKMSNICRIWITSRSYNILNELQNSLGTFSFTLVPLTKKEQKCLLEKALALKLGGNTNDCFSKYVNRFYNTISFAIKDIDNKFTSVPLHLYMICEIYQDFFRYSYYPKIPRLSDKYMQDINDVSNLITLYERFVEIKFYKIRFGEKKPFMCNKDPDLKKIIERERKEFIKNHKMLAAYSIFDRNVEGLFYEDEINRIFENMEKIKLGEEKTGIVDQIVSNVPKFIHLTFAEYFATEYLCDKLKYKNCSAAVWIYLFNTIFTSFENIRRFFECKLQKDQQLMQLSLNKTHKYEVFNMLIKQDNLHHTSLYIAIKEYSSNTVSFILKSMSAIMTKENLNDFITYVGRKCELSCGFCFAVEIRQDIIVRWIMQTVEDIDKTKVINLFKCGDVPMFNALGIAVNYCRYYSDELNLVDALLENVDSEVLLQLFIMPCNMGLVAANALHVLVLNYDRISHIKKHLLKLNKEQRMKLFSATDADRKLPAHIAAECGDVHFFEELKELLDINQFRQICVTFDPLGRTPITYLKENAHGWHKLEALIKDVNENCDVCKIYPM